MAILYHGTKAGWLLTEDSPDWRARLLRAKELCRSRLPPAIQFWACGIPTPTQTA